MSVSVSRSRIDNDSIDHDHDLNLKMSGKELLSLWSIKPAIIDDVIKRLEVEGFGDPDDWIDIYNEQEWLIETIKMDKMQAKKFERKYSEWKDKRKITNA
mmetsp:Transcript_22361/g.19687  ORF Transcript_22361/g.19687 Transcript_22361/m.19687 type:complete len:100 (-) Transcript_22361:69-368(-)